MKKEMSNITFVIILLVIAALCVTTYLVVDKLIIKDEIQEEIGTESLYTMDNFPKIDASLATQPLTDAIISNFTGLHRSEIKTDFSNLFL